MADKNKVSVDAVINAGDLKFAKENGLTVWLG